MPEDKTQRGEIPDKDQRVARAKAILESSAIKREDTSEGVVLYMPLEPDKGDVMLNVRFPHRKGEKVRPICECEEYRQYAICAHAIAGAMFIEGSADQLPEKIRIRDIAALAGEHELRAFVSSEARRNKHLALRMKARFIDEVNLRSGINKYAVLLDELLTISASDDLTLTVRELKLLDQIVGMLLESASRFIALRTYTEASQILLTVLSRIHLCVDKYAVQVPDLADRLIEGYTLLLKLVHGEPAPALCDVIFESGLSLLGKAYHQLPDAQTNILPVLLEADRSQDALHKLMQVLEHRLLNSENPTVWLAWYLYLGPQSGLNPDLDFLSEQFNGGQIFSAVTILDSLQGPDATDKLLVRMFREIALPQHQEWQWIQRVFRYAQRTDDTQLALECGIKLLSSSGRTELVDALLSILAEHPESRRELEKALARQSNQFGLARLYAIEGDDAALLSLLGNSLSLDLAISYAPGLLKHNRHKTVSVIERVLLHFASHHAGPTCTERLQAFYLRLTDAGEAALVRKLRTYLAKEFPGRFRR